MQIILTKGENRHHLYCLRLDGSSTATDLGPSLPIHDLAHYVVESELRMSAGFYGNIASGYSIATLSTKEIIKTLAAESMVAEVLTRAMQSMTTTTSRPQDFLELINWELEVLELPNPEIAESTVATMRIKLLQLLQSWNELAIGERLKLEFPETA